MPKFKDCEGREYDVRITVDTVRRVRMSCDVDLLRITEDETLAKIYGDPVTLCDVLYVVVADQADRLGITDEQFGRSMAGDAIEHATNAFVEALTDFFPSQSLRKNLRAIQAKVRDAEAKAQDLIAARIEATDMDEMVRGLVETHGEGSWSSPESPESNPGP